VSEQDQVRYDIGGWVSGPCLDRPLNQPHGMSPEDATSLFHLRCIWGDRYGISHSGGQWKAHRLGAARRGILQPTPPRCCGGTSGPTIASGRWKREGRRGMPQWATKVFQGLTSKYEASQTAESQLAHDADKLETLIQAA
jgi:hypothetical protein